MGDAVWLRAADAAAVLALTLSTLMSTDMAQFLQSRQRTEYVQAVIEHFCDNLVEHLASFCTTQVFTGCDDIGYDDCS